MTEEYDEGGESLGDAIERYRDHCVEDGGEQAECDEDARLLWREDHTQHGERC